jgi:predicted nucleic acid-binding protein
MEITYNEEYDTLLIDDKIYRNFNKNLEGTGWKISKNIPICVEALLYALYKNPKNKDKKVFEIIEALEILFSKDDIEKAKLFLGEI